MSAVKVDTMHHSACTVPNPGRLVAEDEEEVAVCTVDVAKVDIAVDIAVYIVLDTVVEGYDTIASPTAMAVDTMMITLLHTVIHGRRRMISKLQAVIPSVIQPICTRFWLICLQVKLSLHHTMDRGMASWSTRISGVQFHLLE